MKRIWLEAIVVDEQLERVTAVVSEFELRQPQKGHWSVLVCDGVAGREFDFGVNESAARALYDALAEMAFTDREGHVRFDEKGMETTFRQGG